jgi:hypothetical protein
MELFKVLGLSLTPTFSDFTRNLQTEEEIRIRRRRSGWKKGGKTLNSRNCEKIDLVQKKKKQD